MATLAPTRPAWSCLTRRRLATATTTTASTASTASPTPSALLLLRALPSSPAAARRPISLLRQPTALRERNDTLNQPPELEDETAAQPRWSRTPPGLASTLGFPLREAKDPANTHWAVNDDPAVLDAFYERFLGPGGARMLPEELRWLAVTHKSFDYGRRGFNTRLAYFGRHIVVLETMNRIMLARFPVDAHLDDPWRRQPFQPAALARVDKLSVQRPADYMSLDSIARVGRMTQLDQVMRWKPRNVHNLELSGIQLVLTTALFAIVGAVSLQSGAMAASTVVKDSLLERMRSNHME